MSLPSSAPINRLTVGVQSPDINLAAYTPRPAAQDDAFARGFQIGQGISDSVVLRPAVVSAQRKQAELAGMTADSDKNLVTAKEANTRQRLDTENQVNSTVLTSAEQSQKDLVDPGWRIRAAHAQVVALTDDSQKAAQAIIDAHAAGDEAKIEAAIKKKAAVDKDLSSYQSRLNLLIANQTAAEHAAAATAKGAQRADVLAAGALNQAPTDAETNLFNAATANSEAENAATAAGTFESKDAAVAKAVADRVAAAGSANVAAAPFRSPEVAGALDEGAKAQAVGSALQAKAGLAYLVSQLANGNYAGGISPEQDKSIRDEATKSGVPVILPNGGKRPLAEVAAELAKRQNVKDGEKQVADIRDAAQAGTKALAAIKQIKNLGDVNTGALYTLPVVGTLDSFFAQAGVDQSQKREIFKALNQQLVPLVRQPGSVSNFEQQMYARAVPGPGLADRTNSVLLKGLLAVGERTAAKPAFYDSLLGTLPIGEVNKLWNQYVDQNPSMLDENTVNGSQISPDQYAKFLSADPKTADALVRSLAVKADVSSLPRGNTPAEFAAAPASAPFIAAADARGQTIPIPNPKYWQPVLAAAAEVRKAQSVSSPASDQQAAAFTNALNRPAEDFIRPAKPVQNFTAPPLEIFKARK